MSYSIKPFDPQTPESLDYVLAKHVMRTLTREGRSLEAAAKVLGVSERALRGRLPGFGISIKKKVIVWVDPFPSTFEIVKK